MKATYILLAILWGVYFFLHSLLARQWVKQRIQGHPAVSSRAYRLGYNLLALLGLLGLLYFTMRASAEPWFPATAALRFVALMLATWGVIIIRLCFKQYSWKAFAGLEKEEAEILQTTGLLQYIRHPMYAGAILLVTGFWLYIPTTATFISCLVVILYVFIGIQLEERSLIKKYGQAYIAYKKRVPMLVPFYYKLRGEK